MNGVQCKVIVSNLTSESFESHKSLRQGDGLPSLLFNFALEGVIQSAGLDNDILDTILYRSLQFFGFTDVIDIISNAKQQVLY